MANGVHFNTKRERDAYHAAGGEYDYDFPEDKIKRGYKSFKQKLAIKANEKIQDELVSIQT